MRLLILAGIVAAFILPIAVLSVDAQNRDCTLTFHPLHRHICRLENQIITLRNEITHLEQLNADLRTAPEPESEWRKLNTPVQFSHYYHKQVPVEAYQHKDDRGLIRAEFGRGHVEYSVEIFAGGKVSEGLYFKRTDSGVGYAQFDRDGRVDDLRVCVSMIGNADIKPQPGTEIVYFKHKKAECTSFPGVDLRQDGGRRE